MTKPFTTPFAENGDVMFIPETAQSDGSVSYETGFGPDYSADPLEANAKPVPRAGHNELFNQITGSIGDIQRQGAADWYLEFAADGGYPKNAIVWLDGDRWKSRIDGNTTRPNIDEIAWLPSAKFEGGGSGGGGDFGLTGPTTIAVGGSFQYKISPYSSFMTYAVSATNGKTTISGDTITLTIAPGETANVTDLTVIRSDGARNDFRIAIGAQSIAKPSMLSPASGSVDVPLGPLLTASAFMTYPVGADTHLNTDWRIRTMAGAVVWQSLANAANKTNIQVPDNTLPLNTQLQADVRYRGTTLPVSAWSDAVTFTTTNQSILTPTITSPLNGAIDIGETPTFTATAFATNPPGADSHVSSDWRLKNAGGTIIWASTANTVNKLSIPLPSGVLATSSQYTIEVRYNGAILQPSQWSPVVAFTTASQFAFGKYLAVGTVTDPNLTTYGVDVDTFNKLPAPVTLPGSNVLDIAYSSATEHVAVAVQGSPYLTLYKRSGDQLVRLANPATMLTGPVRAVAFSPDGVYLAVGLNITLMIYKRNGDVFTLLAPVSPDITWGVRGLAWSPDGASLAVAGPVLTGISVYNRSGDSLTRVFYQQASSDLAMTGACFSPDGTYLVVTKDFGPYVDIYKRSVNVFTRLTNSFFVSNGALGACFSPDGLYLALGVFSGNGFTWCKRAGDAFTPLPNPATMPGGTQAALAYSADGRHLAIAIDTASGAGGVLIYRQNGDSLTKLANPAVLPPAGRCQAVAFYPPVLGS